MAISESNIDFSEVRSYLGTYVFTLGELCTDSAIKMWSRMKPVRISSVAPDRSGKWWKSDRGNCGINISGAETNSISRVPDLYTSDMANGYDYERPTGGELQPYRLRDFGGYYHNAVSPIAGFSCTARIDGVNTTISGQVSFNVADYDKTSPGSLSMEEIGGFVVDGRPASLGDMYFGLAVVDGVGSVRLYKTSAGLGGIATLDGRGLSPGTYKVYPFLCSVAQDGVSEKRGSYFSIPNTAFQQLEVVGSLVLIDLHCQMQYNASDIRQSVYFKLYVEQDVQTSKSFSGNYITLFYKQTNSYGHVTEEVVEQRKLPDFSVQRGESYYVGDGFLGYNKYLDRYQVYYVRVSLNNGSYKREMTPMDKPIGQ